MNEILTLSGLNPNGKRFDDWVFDDTQQARQATILANLKGYLDTLGKTSPNILLTGATGTGKSLLCNAMGLYFYDKHPNRFCHFEKTSRLTQRIKATWGDASKSEWDILEQLSKVSLLLLDDLGDGDALGAEGGANDRARFGQLIDARYQKRPTVITTNLTTTDTARFLGDRAWDRFIQNVVFIECNWQNYRQKTARMVSW